MRVHRVLALCVTALICACSGGNETSDSGAPPDPGTESNAAPVADAGGHQSVSEGASVLLDGRASLDSDGSIVRYRWQEVQSTTGVLISDADTAQASFELLARQALGEGEAAAAASLQPTVTRLMASEDAGEGLRAMLERRPGDFKGR